VRPGYNSLYIEQVTDTESTDCDCKKCESYKSIPNWQQIFKNAMNDLVLRSNLHMYCTLISTNEKKSKKSREGVSTSIETARHNLQANI